MKELLLNDIREYFKIKYGLDEKKIQFATVITYNSNHQTENPIILSSIDFVEFMVYIEEKYNIIYDFDVTLDTVEQIIQYIIEHYDDTDYTLNV